jgi:hypothetical protein
MKMSDRYETTDLALAAFLTARGHKLVGVGGTPSRSVFAFERSAGLVGDTLAWVNNSPVRVQARSMFNSMRDLKGVAATF